MTRRERMERRAERRKDWADSRKAKAEQSFGSAQSIASCIPLGQPILVGHHSEKRHRRDLERIDSAMRRGIESEKMASEHLSKAAGIESALDRSIFSDDENAVEALEKKIVELEAQRDRNTETNKAIRRKLKTGQIVPAYVNSNLGGRIRQAKQRILAIKNAEVGKAKAEAAGGVLVSGSGDYCTVSFSEYPGREKVDAMKAAGFHWGSGAWHGRREKLPDFLKERP